MMYQLEDKVRELESMMEEWEFFSKPYTDEAVLKKFGFVKLDDENIQITNSMMETVLEVTKLVGRAIKDRKQASDGLHWDIKILRRDLEKAKEFAAMSDERIADELDKEISWFNANSGQEDLVYGPVELMGYCRDRLRNR